MGQTARTTEHATPKTPRAVMLLRQLVEKQEFDRERLARELVVTTSQLDAYLAGTREMPLDRQLCLALFLIEQVPALARQGYSLRGQVIAATAYASHRFAPGALRPSEARGR